MSHSVKLDREILLTLFAEESSCENAEIHDIGIYRGEHLAKPDAVRKEVDILLHPRQMITEIIQDLRESIHVIENSD